MPSVAEMQLLNRAIEQAGDAFYRNRVLRQQETEGEKDRALRRELEQSLDALRRDELAVRREDLNDARENRRLGLEATNKRYDEQRAHEGRLEGYQQKLLENQQSKAAIEGLNNAFGALAEGVKNRTIPAREANARAKAIVQQVLSSPNLILQQTPFAKLMTGEGDLFQDVPEMEDVTETSGDPLTGTQSTRKFRQPVGARSSSAAAPALTPEQELEAAMEAGQTAPLRAERAEHLKQIGQGDRRHGFLNIGNREARVKEIDAELSRAERVKRGGLQDTNAPAALDLSQTNNLAPLKAEASAGPGRPPGKSDAELLAELKAAIAARPEQRNQLLRMARAWGLNVGGL